MSEQTNVRRLHKPMPAPALPTPDDPLDDKDIHVLVGLANAVAHHARNPEALPLWCNGDKEWVSFLGQRFGEVAEANNFGVNDIDGAILDLAATCVAMLAVRERQRSR
jgi:hypothetical protein